MARLRDTLPCWGLGAWRAEWCHPPEPAGAFGGGADGALPEGAWRDLHLRFLSRLQRVQGVSSGVPDPVPVPRLDPRSRACCSLPGGPGVCRDPAQHWARSGSKAVGAARPPAPQQGGGKPGGWS